MAIAPAATKIGFSLRAAHLVGDQRQRVLSSMRTTAANTWGFEKRPGSAQGYRSHPAGVKRQRSISLSTLDTPCDPVCCFFRMKVGLHRLKGGSTQVDPCAHANAAGQQLGAIRAQNYRTRALCHLNRVRWPRATCAGLHWPAGAPDATRASGDPDRQEPATVDKRCATSLLMDYLRACASPGMKRQPLIGR